LIDHSPWYSSEENVWQQAKEQRLGVVMGGRRQSNSANQWLINNINQLGFN
jgi:hypothetical protein